MDSTTGENEKLLLAATVRDRIIGNKNFIVYKEILDQKIPTFLKNYLQNSIQKFIHTEEPVQFGHSKRFDFELPKIVELKNALIKALEEAAIFSRQEVIEIINRTVSLQFNLLVKPGITLLKIFYKNQSDRVQNEILQILEGLEDRRIFIQKLIKNIKEFDQFHIVEDDFKKILQRTNQQVYEEDVVHSFISDVYAFNNFLSMIHGYESKKIDINLLKLLLVERKLQQYSHAFDVYHDTKISLDKINLTLTTFIARNRKKEDTDLEVGGIRNNLTEPITEGGDSDEIDQNLERIEPGAANAWEKYANNNIFIEEEAKKFPKITNIWKDPLDMIITRSKIEEQPEGPLPSLKKMIAEKDKNFIQKRIFDNDGNAYSEFIKQLESIDNWKEAKKVIDQELFMRSITPYSKEALRLGDLVFNRYFPTNH